MWVPHKEYKNKKKFEKQTKGKQTDGRTEDEDKEKILFYFFSFRFLLRFTKTCPSEFVGINTKSALRDEGYA